MRNTEIIDSIEYEVISSQDAQPIFEIPINYPNDEEITMPTRCENSKIYFCDLDGEKVFTGYPGKADKIPANLVVKNENLQFMADSLESLANSESPWQKEYVKDNEGDKLSIFFESNWGHDLPAPYERIVIRNERKYILDGLRSHLLVLELPKKAAQDLAKKLSEYLA